MQWILLEIYYEPCLASQLYCQPHYIKIHNDYVLHYVDKITCGYHVFFFSAVPRVATGIKLQHRDISFSINQLTTIIFIFSTYFALMFNITYLNIHTSVLLSYTDSIF